ncbi:MAG: hypothetical protein A3C93_00015 [Candidatus Lloydbacteria bacterium RIFCSPHIGHO2_02_FULL_54_17]|uniref:General secretion pathway GspH domain-containing protein n=1 Tax=Candidatus Lloydbacteria bacterium RIFCSPHIGHO2_02_FULL_54_17 TaxID=1798664 RepID=A0A1G2DKE9_9BACT|nr:MAG: hypothetical protein A2762_03775 [Candidatus Lloydbacteria bacterium RIFCSPHIGHO2_01_FULL_54_11]OGZ13288.1 MAG: hypothetical protein A3C93_00015 [Candidatus Lloydbacteria bacterium RIFCSPHIGHO2_02_FULL_54_17]OGZ17095.1 MAG: hypothetical protein A3H76_02810 [Candidatus Lloydbacteria bacterium RIFCSPLOWO2_02_FULL_54_12]
MYNVPLMSRRRRFLTQKGERGITLLEILVVTAIVLLLSSMALAAFGTFRARKTMDVTVEVVMTSFGRARLDTISSKDDQQYGVHLESDKAVYFIGPTYSSGAPTNIVYAVDPVLEIANVTLTGGGSEVLFNRLTGGTGQSGTFEIRLKGNTSIRTLITVNGTGAVTL